MKDIKYINNERSTEINLNDAVPIIRLKLFSKYENELIHGFSTRLGGVSTGHLSSLNLSFSRGDKTENVMTNHMRLADCMGYDYKKLVFSDQVHKTNIRICTEEDAGKGIIRESDIKETDALITDVPGLPLITFYADCVPLYFYSHEKRVVALAHSGWRGTVAGIGTKVLLKMKEVYGVRPEEVICGIGPSICKNCYEVSEDVADEFRNKYTKEQFEDMIEEKNDGKYLLDLHKACRYNFIAGGAVPENIAVTDICTCCNDSLLFSHRKTGGMRGNLAAVIMLNVHLNRE